MGKRYNQFRFYSESGFTLVEIMAAMVILLLIVTACFPLFTMATKTTHENRARLTANELAKRELERILAQVTPSNYVSEDVTAPLKTGISATYYFDDNGDPIDARDDNSRFARFEACKIVQWIDDDADGVYPADKFPFDYKVLIIEVSSPSLFTGKVTKQADFKTFVAREGTASPITGVIVEVIRGWTDEAGKPIPLEGAQVSLTGVGPSHTAMTNADGQALIPMTFPNDNTEYSYAVQTEYSGMITRPDQKAGKSVDARPYTTNFVQVEMEEPASLTLRFAPSKKDVEIALDGGPIMGGIIKKTLAAGQSSVTFTNLWPAGADPDHPGRVCAGGTYSLDVPALLAYSKLPATGSKYPLDLPADPDDPDDHALLNLWNYIDPYDNNDGISAVSDTTPAWVASEDYLSSGDEINSAQKHRLEFLNLDSTGPEIVDLKSFKPVLAGVTARLTASFAEFTLSEYTNLTSNFILVYLGKEDAELDSNDSDDWIPFIKIGIVGGKWALLDENDITLKEETDDHKIIIPPTDKELGLKEAYFSEPFKMRFDSDRDIGTFYFRTINIHCTYDKFPSIEFTCPGDQLSLHISG